MMELGLVERTENIVGGFGGGSSGHVYMTKEGRKKKPTLAMRHSLLVGDVGLSFYKAALDPEDRVRQFDPEYQIENVTADALMAYQHDGTVLDAFVEVETGSQSAQKVQRKVSRYVNLHLGGDWQKQLEVWPVVLFVASSDEHRDKLRRATEALEIPDTTEFSFATQKDVVAEPLGPIWYVQGLEGQHSLFEDEEAA